MSHTKTYILILLTALVSALIFGLWTYSQEPKEKNSLTLFGNVDIRQVNLGFRVFGKVSELYVDEGDVVIPGKLLAQLDPEPYIDAMEKAKANLEKSEAELANAEKIFQRREGLAPLGSISEENYSTTLYNQLSLKASLKEAQANYKEAALKIKDTSLFSDQKGVILSRIREAGSVLQPGDPVFVVSIASPVWVRAYVSEPNLGKIYPGMMANIYTDTSSNPTYKGHIGFISPVAEFTPKNVETTDLRTDLVYRLRIIVDDADDGLRQGMPITVELLTGVDNGNSG